MTFCIKHCQPPLTENSGYARECSVSTIVATKNEFGIAKMITNEEINQAGYTNVDLHDHEHYVNVKHDIQALADKQRNQSKPCEVYKQSYNAKPKYVSECQPKTITSLTKENTLEYKTKKPEESSLNWKPLPNDWAVTTSKTKAVQTNNPEDNIYRYNRKGFLEDDDNTPMLVPSNPGVPLRVTPIQFALLVVVDTKESVVELQ
nr:hypothetical protein [Tanacetum cinerariifolium]